MSQTFWPVSLHITSRLLSKSLAVLIFSKKQQKLCLLSGFWWSERPGRTALLHELHDPFNSLTANALTNQAEGEQYVNQ